MVVLSNDHHEEQEIILIEERRCSSLPSSPAKRVSPAKRKQFYILKANRNSDLTPRAKGKKSLRRQENSMAPALARLTPTLAPLTPTLAPHPQK